MSQKATVTSLLMRPMLTAAHVEDVHRSNIHEVGQLLLCLGHCYCGCAEHLYLALQLTVREKPC